ncbi:MAG: tRNA (N6-isopentenyl adenosine(37)-C2)-methylthiotransferase MiaB [Planctomycetales bacterium]|nr:tRNA (N6-isopentenyl adenosine(37)-C2)-methylthiotransferase MiaB [Planctomycetales bacterium]
MGGMSKKLYIETWGCQMNVLDSEMVVASLRHHGYELTSHAKAADTVLLNTCSVRQLAEDKVYSSLGRVRILKENNPELVVGVMGCMAQREQEQIFKRVPFVDLVVGPGQLRRIPELIERVRNGEGPQIEISLGRQDGSAEEIRRSHETYDPLRDPAMRPSPWQAYVRIQIGCDKFCTYCIVPMVRGPEQGRPPAQIIEEARLVAAQGCREITLLGQTVNSYQFREGDRVTRLADLLEALHDIEGIDRLKFVTNYPKDMTDELLQAVRDLPKCSPYLHVPAQSGSNAVLERMKRGYTVEEYRDMMQRIRETIPDAAVSSDFIVGFCGETDEDFAATMDLVADCRFKNSFIFKYSPRPSTKADSLLIDDISHEVKNARNNELLALQNRISMEDNQRFVGQHVEVLVEGPSKSARNRQEDGPIVQLTGRTHCDRIVVFEGNERQAGHILPVSIYSAHSHTLFGQIVTQHITPEVVTLDVS